MEPHIQNLINAVNVVQLACRTMDAIWDNLDAAIADVEEAERPSGYYLTRINRADTNYIAVHWDSTDKLWRCKYGGTQCANQSRIIIARCPDNWFPELAARKA